MCGKEDVKRQIEEAIQIEEENPEHARRNYLEAAETLLFLSTQPDEEKEKCVQLAELVYQKAQALKDRKPRKRIEAHEGAFGFDAIGGLDELKEEIRLKIILPLQHPDVYDYFGKKLGGGILMYGPPGCGKSMIAEATAHEAGVAFFNVKASDLKSKFVGETEKNIHELFQKAREHSPSIIFFDEFESVGTDRSIGQMHEKSMMGQLLAEMDGVGNKDKRILLLAATNEPWNVDMALLRGGRFGTTILVPEPDEESRREMFRILLAGKPIAEDIDIECLVRITEGYAGADIAGLCEKATDYALRDYFKTKTLRKITQHDFKKAGKEIRSFVKPWYVRAQEAIKSHGLHEQFGKVLEKEVKVVQETA